MKVIPTEVYENLALQFYQPGHRHHNYLFHGLEEEVQEVLDAETEADVLDELGDVLWYITVLANRQGASLKEVMLRNINKLEKRQLKGK